MFLIKTVILAAGKGKRMGASVPKPLVPIAGKPMVEHLVDTVCSLQQQEKPIVVVSPSGEEMFREVLKDRVAYAVQHEALGTGDAVKASRAQWGGADSVMVLYADHPFLPQQVLQELTEACVQEPRAIHMLTATVPNYEGDYAKFASWGRIIRNAHGEPQDIREVKDATPEEREIHEVNPAMYVFPATWLGSALDRLTNVNASGEYYLTDVIGLAAHDGLHLRTTTTDARAVIGVNTPEDLVDAERQRHAEK